MPDGTPCEPQDLPLTRSALHGEVCRNVELVVDWPDGQRRDLLVASAPIFSGAGKVIGAVGVFEDVTALKDLERSGRAGAIEGRVPVRHLPRAKDAPRLDHGL